MPAVRRPRVAVLYHYFHPDDVVSARHFGDFAADLAQRGWEVEALPCNRGCRDDRQTYAATEEWAGVRIHRIWRPRFRQASGLGRMLNAVWMLGAWSRLAWRRGPERPDVVVIGTDPVLSILVAPVIRWANRPVRLVHWAYDLYPEAPVAEGMLGARSLATRLIERLLRAAYGACDLVADLGPCMRELLEKYGHRCKKTTLVPWALVEPPAVEPADPVVRGQLFGQAKLGLLYSGNFGRAHAYEEFLALARQLRGSGVHFCFAVRGNRAEELRAAVTADDTNISFAGFAAESELAARLAAADIHLASLRPHWTGVVVPSKFFGSLASGRPVLFAGESQAAIARWIREYQLGWELRPETLPTVAAELRRLADQPAELAQWRQRCFAVYHAHFSRRRIMDAWDQELRALLPVDRKARAAGPAASETRPG